MMISIKTIQTSFLPTKDAILHLHIRKFPNKKKTNLCRSKPNDDGTEAPPPPPPPEGDVRAQDLLAQIVMKQTQKVRLTDYLDEKSAFLTQFAEEANAEMDQIGENAIKDLDEAGERIMGNLESQMKAFEEAAELERLEIETKEKQLAEFEGQIEEDRNEGLFFKNLRQSAPVDKVKAQEEMNKIKEVTKEYASSKTRKNFYLVFMGLLVLGIIEALSSSLIDWPKVAVLVLIFVTLSSQFIKEQKISSDTENKGNKTSEEQKE